MQKQIGSRRILLWNSEKKEEDFFHRLIELSGGISEITNFNVIFVKLHVIHYFIVR